MRILLTGATGYIGRRLQNRLQRDPQVQLRLFVRNARKVEDQSGERVEIVEGDTFNRDALDRATTGIDVAYYLIHSMGASQDFSRLDRISAENFRDACIQAGVKRIVYLGGLGIRESASKHLLSRIETGEILSAIPERIQTIWFRAGVIIGSGSASFEILRNLVQKLPVMVTPRWVTTLTQPIAVDDVLAYLEQARVLKDTGNIIVDIGSEPVSFKGMMLRAAEAMGLKRYVFGVPVLSPRLSSYWLVFFTPVPYRVAAALVEGLRSETLLQNDNAPLYFPSIHPMPFQEAVRLALAEIEDRQVVSRWCDSSGGEACDIPHVVEISKAVFRDRRLRHFGDLSSARVYAAVLSVGGERGWLGYDLLWKIRGIIDTLCGGYGLGRGRRDPHMLRVGDSVDFWKVLEVRENRRLLLEAQMKLPGKAWLEFVLEGQNLIITAHFLPRGVLGRVYWYATFPFHQLVFKSLANGIVARAREAERG